MSWVFFAFSLSRATERLAWISGSDATNFSSKDSCREGFKIRVDRRVIHASFFNLRNQVGAAEGFDLDINDCAHIHARSSKSKFNPSVSCTKADNVLGIIHIYLTTSHISPFRGVTFTSSPNFKYLPGLHLNFPCVPSLNSINRKNLFLGTAYILATLSKGISIV